MACAVAALLFLRFWKVSRERLFLFFSLAFAVLGLNWFCLALFTPGEETRYYFYLLRLCAFVLIIAGIVDKNRRVVARRRPADAGVRGE
jgi:peptidoglycan/LPS O-acetylase OafA/YrhL